MPHNTARDRLFTRRLPGHTVIAIRGDLDIGTTAALRDRILTVLKDTAASVIIDLSEVSFCDASGLALLVGTRRRAGLYGVNVVLAAPRPSVRKLLHITGLDRAFTIHPTLVAAQLGRSRTDHRATT